MSQLQYMPIHTRQLIEELGEEVIELVVVRHEHVQAIFLDLFKALCRIDTTLVQNAAGQSRKIVST